MEKFTLEAAQLGRPLITRDGRPARYVAVMQRSNPQFPLVVEVFKGKDFEDEQGKGLDKEFKDNTLWHMENFSIDGEFLPPFENELDLFVNTL